MLPPSRSVLLACLALATASCIERPTPGQPESGSTPEVDVPSGEVADPELPDGAEVADLELPDGVEVADPELPDGAEVADPELPDGGEVEGPGTVCTVPATCGAGEPPPEGALLVRVADPDSDGCDELLLPDQATGKVYVLHRDDAGASCLETLSLDVGPLKPPRATDVAVADFDGDGAQDYVVLAYSGDDRDAAYHLVRVPGDGAAQSSTKLHGLFSDPWVHTPNGDHRLVPFDYDGQGGLDLSPSSDGSLFVARVDWDAFEYVGAGAERPIHDWGPNCGYTYPDLAFAFRLEQPEGPDDLLAVGQGCVARLRNLGAAFSSDALDIVDVPGSAFNLAALTSVEPGSRDVLSAFAGKLYALLGADDPLSSLLLDLEIAVESGTPDDFAAADLDGDGVVDGALAYSNDSSRWLRVLPGIKRVEGKLVAKTATSAMSIAGEETLPWVYLVAANLDGVGPPELAVVTTSGQARCFRLAGAALVECAAEQE